MFDINSQVICVDDRFDPEVTTPYVDIATGVTHTPYTHLPVKNRIYTVRDIIPAQRIPRAEGETIAILLREIVNPIQPRVNAEPGFASWRFVEPEHLSEYDARKEKERIEEQRKRREERKNPSPTKVPSTPELVPTFQ
jgi:hypothetical protein